MNMIRQNADRSGFKRISLLDGSVDVSEAIYFVNQKAIRPLRQNDGEKEYTPLGANVTRHGNNLSLRKGISRWWARFALSY